MYKEDTEMKDKELKDTGSNCSNLIDKIVFDDKVDRDLNHKNKITTIYSENKTVMMNHEIINDDHQLAKKKIVVISGPSGSGKSTIMMRLLNDPDIKDEIKFSVSHTTRKERAGEYDGKDYHFIKKNLFLNMINNNNFIEYAIYNGNYYGTSIYELVDNVVMPSINKNRNSKEDFKMIDTTKSTKQEKEKILVLDLEKQGVLNLYNRNFNCLFIFIYCSKDDIEKRLISRTGANDLSDEQQNEINNRLNEFDSDMKVANTGIYHACIENKDLEGAVLYVKHLIHEFMIN